MSQDLSLYALKIKLFSLQIDSLHSSRTELRNDELVSHKSQSQPIVSLCLLIDPSRSNMKNDGLANQRTSIVMNYL